MARAWLAPGSRSPVKTSPATEGAHAVSARAGRSRHRSVPPPGTTTRRGPLPRRAPRRSAASLSPAGPRHAPAPPSGRIWNKPVFLLVYISPTLPDS